MPRSSSTSSQNAKTSCRKGSTRRFRSFASYCVFLSLGLVSFYGKSGTERTSQTPLDETGYSLGNNRSLALKRSTYVCVNPVFLCTLRRACVHKFAEIFFLAMLWRSHVRFHTCVKANSGAITEVDNDMVLEIRDFVGVSTRPPVSRGALRGSRM